VTLFQYDGRVGNLAVYNYSLSDSVEIQMLRCYCVNSGIAVDPSSCEPILLVFEVPLSLQVDASTPANNHIHVQHMQLVEYNKLLHVFISATLSHTEASHLERYALDVYTTVYTCADSDLKCERFRSKPVIVMAVMNEGLTHFVSTKYLHHHSQALEVSVALFQCCARVH
jgi:hypothetical protein